MVEYYDLLLGAGRIGIPRKAVEYDVSCSCAIGQMAVFFGAGDRRYGYENRDGTDFIVTSGISG